MTVKVKDAKAPARKDFGDVLLEHGVLKEPDLSYARKIRDRMDHPKPLGEVLVGLKLITRSQLKKFLRIYKTQIPLGELLVENGILTRSQVEEALEEQQENRGKRLGEILIEKKFISERDLIKAVCEQKDYPYVEPNLAMLDDELLGHFSLNYLLNNNLIPLTREEGKLQVLASEILRPDTVKELESAFQCPLTFALATRANIASVLEDYRKTKAGGHQVGSEADSPMKVVELADFIITEAIEMGASDIHFEPLHNRLRLRFRIDGVLVHRTDIPKEMEPRLIARLKVIAELDIAEKRRHQDGRFHFMYKGVEVDMRVSTYVTIHGENMVIRILNKQMGLVDLEELGMPPKLLANYTDFVLGAPAGVVVITGPTGSGKTTTLYSSIDAVNDIGLKIITAEDPVEYQIEGIMQCSINPKAGLTFDDTLKAIVRQDPDIIVLGEIRDRTSAATAIQAALTGHKVFTTFHTEDAVGGLLRLMNMEIETFLISSTVICMVAQRLVRRICDDCKEETVPSAKNLMILGVDPMDMKDFTFYKGRGCENCHYTGYRGRTAVYELLVMNEKVKDAILEHKTSSYIRKISIKDSGLVTMQESGIAKVVQGHTTFEEVLHKAPFSFKPRPVKEIFSIIGEDF